MGTQSQAPMCRRMWQQLSGDEAAAHAGHVPAGPQLGGIAWWDTTVEDLVAIVQRLPHREPVVPAVMHGCALARFMMSRLRT